MVVIRLKIATLVRTVPLFVFENVAYTIVVTTCYAVVTGYTLVGHFSYIK
jgi:hypothetical protein